MLEYESPQVSTLGGNPYGPCDKNMIWCVAVIVLYAAYLVAVLAIAVMLLKKEEGP